MARLTDVRAGQPVIETETVKIAPLRVPGKRAGTLKDAPRVGVHRLVWWQYWFRDSLTSGACDLVMMEMPATHDVQGVLAFGEQLGVLKVMLCDADVPLAWVSIGEVKKYATGMGKPDDLRMIQSAVDEFGEQVNGKDQADACWICKIAYDAFGEGTPENKYRESVCAKLRAQFPHILGGLG